MKKILRKQLSTVIGGLIAASAVSYAQADALFTPHNVPLNLGGMGAPNIIYNMDESWSMAWRYMPDELNVGGTVFYGNPWATSSGDGDDTNGYRWGIGFHPNEPSTCWNSVDGCTANGGTINTFIIKADSNGIATDLLAARLRSPIFNTIYYNPDIRYDPWYGDDGKPYTAADPKAARIHPLSPTPTVNLIGDQVFSNGARWCGSTVSGGAVNNTTPECATNLGSLTMAPASWFEYTGSVDSNGVPTDAAQLNSASNFKLVSIKDLATGAARPTTRTDCAAIRNKTGNICTQLEEYQNFANWFEFNRSRMFVAIAATTKAFANRDGDIRVGVARLHFPTGVNLANRTYIERGVRSFSGADKKFFYTWMKNMGGSYMANRLYGDRNATTGHYFEGGTPLIQATEAIGNYYKTDEPWRVRPEDASSGLLSCRKSYHILMTDGAATDIPSGKTLESVAKSFYTDLRLDLDNNVIPDAKNPATFQHMVNYTVGLGVNIEDQRKAAEVSKGEYLSANNPQEFSDGLAKILAAIAAGSKSNTARTVNLPRLSADTLVYDAGFESENWSGRLEALQPVVKDTGIEYVRVWEAGSLIPTYANRKLYTHSGDFSGTAAKIGQGRLLDWNNVDKVAFNNDQSYFNYVRGSRSGEGSTYRKRTSLLGDVVNSNPVVAGTTYFGYTPTRMGVSGYADHYQKKGARGQTIFVGSNNGFLHAFDAMTGAERFAYMPRGVMQGTAIRGLGSTSFTHNFLVDGRLHYNDAYIDGSWRSVLVGGLGAGGKTVFALDITEPALFDENKVLWEFSEPDMGYSYGEPVVGRLKNGTWVAVFGNGFGQKTITVKEKGQDVIKDVGIDGYLYIVDLKDGKILHKLSAGTQTGGLGAANFVYEQNSKTKSGDGFLYIHKIYAGDRSGNLYMFEDTGNHSSVSFAAGKKLFSALDAAGKAQPVTVQPVIAPHPDGQAGNMIFFGTGSYSMADDVSAPKLTDVQSVYAVWDDGKTTALTRASLEQRNTLAEVTVSDSTYRIVQEGSSINWANKYGWYMDLMVGGLKQGERVVFEPRLDLGRLYVRTLIPSTNPCAGGGSGWEMFLDIATGGRLPYSVFDVNSDGVVNELDYVVYGGVKVPVSGIKSTEIPTGGELLVGDEQCFYGGRLTSCDTRLVERRQSWEQLQ